MSSEPIPLAPFHAARVVRNGKTRAGSPDIRCRCRGCARRFVADPKRLSITEERKELGRRLLQEHLSLRTIARATGV